MNSDGFLRTFCSFFSFLFWGRRVSNVMSIKVVYFSNQTARGYKRKNNKESEGKVCIMGCKLGSQMNLLADQRKTRPMVTGVSEGSDGKHGQQVPPRVKRRGSDALCHFVPTVIMELRDAKGEIRATYKASSLSSLSESSRSSPVERKKLAGPIYETNRVRRVRLFQVPIRS